MWSAHGTLRAGATRLTFLTVGMSGPTVIFGPSCTASSCKKVLVPLGSPRSRATRLPKTLSGASSRCATAPETTLRISWLTGACVCSALPCA
eukprot:11178842-Lingulodinium_polyedra.AAC.1